MAAANFTSAGPSAGDVPLKGQNGRNRSAHSAGLTRSVKINHLIYVTLLQTGTRKRNFWKKPENALMAAP
jgi:hypothetical protein